MSEKTVKDGRKAQKDGRLVAPQPINDPTGRVSVFLPMDIESTKHNIECAAEIVGGKMELANLMGYAHRSVVNMWMTRGGCPLTEAWKIEILTGGEILAEEVCRNIVYRCA